MTTTTFKQDIDGTKCDVTIPVSRVTTIIDRVDRLIDKKKFDKALDVLQPFIGAQVVITKKTDTFADIIEQYRDTGRYAVMTRLIAAGMSKASAYYRVRKAGLL